MHLITGILVFVILIILICTQILTEHKRAYDDAIRTLRQIESVLAENRSELDEIEEIYRNTCIHNAEVVAYIIESNPEILTSVEKLKDIAVSMEIDEIHIFDETGCIFAGTNPEYYGLTLDSGEQVRFFLPMLEDKSLELVQDITPNTAESKLMQYSAIWSYDEKYIVQVGMEPVNVMKVTEKNELSHVFSHFRINPSAHYYAVNIENGEIVGSTDMENAGNNIDSIGIELSQITNEKGFYTKVNGKWAFCVFEQIDGNYIGRVITVSNLYQRVPTTAVWILVSLLIVTYILAKVVVWQMNRHVVMKIDEVNNKLQSIADGNLDEKLDMRSSVEFYKLSGYINIMVNSLLENNKKMSYALSKTNMQVGTYEYHKHLSRVKYTEYIPRIFSLTDREMESLASDKSEFIVFLDDIRKSPVIDEEGIYKYDDLYIRIEEIASDDEIFGVVVDCTIEMNKIKEIEKERDIDVLTGLYNRRGLDKQLDKLFAEHDKLGYSAIVMIDADGLKGINDNYGHEKGDIYLKKIANIINNYGIAGSVASRQGGDEYVLFLYGYDSEEELLRAIESLQYIQNHNIMHIDKNLDIAVRFSMGYSIVNDCTDYHKLLKEADEKMYQNKLERKRNLQ